MNTDTASDTTSSYQSSGQIHRLAWVIILVSFALFCSISVAITGGIYFFLFHSTIPMTVSLQVGRGTVPVTTIDAEQVVRSRSAKINLVDRASNVSTDAQSQATLSVELPREDGTVAFATITVQNNSNISFISAQRPRFGWSAGSYSVEMADFEGEADILITQPPDRSLSLRIRTLANTTFLIDEPGRYSISANRTSIRLITYEGEAVLLAPVRDNNRLVSRGEQAILRTGGNVPVISSAPINLLENGSFTFDLVPAQEGDSIPQRWACFRTANAPPSGAWYTDSWEGRPALRLINTENATANSQTGCFQTVNLNVTQYSLLEFKSTILINYQSLSNCGQDGSECPVMLFIDFTDVNGNQRTWTQGIFYNFDPQSPFPLFCRTCSSANEHRQISDKVWYTYESGNLVDRLPEDERPAYISDIRFYASGHQYDVFVSEMALYAGTQVIPPSVEPENGD